MTLSILFFEGSTTKTKEIDSSTKKVLIETEAEEIKTPDVNFKAAALFGIEFNLDTEKAAKALHDLITKE